LFSTQERAETIFRERYSFSAFVAGYHVMAMKVSVKRWAELLKTAASDWMNDKAPRLGAALAFYTIFSLAPLMTIVISVAALWFSDNASGYVFSQLGSIVGADNAKSLQEMLVQPPGEKTSGIFTTISAGLMLVVGATGVFIQLQDSLNEIWEVKPKPGQGLIGFVRHRLLSFAMVLAIAFLLLVSLLLSTAIAAAGKYFSQYFGDAQWLFELLNNVGSFGLITLLFAMMFKYVPDAKIAWRDVWFGAVFTAALFTIGKFGLGMYLGKSSVVSTYKAAGALLILLLWVYYSAQIIFYGAELTQAYASMRGRAVRPSEYAQNDEAKAAQTAAAQADREEKAKRRAGWTPQPTFVAGPAMRATSRSRQRHSKKFWGGLLLIAVVLWPFEKKLFAARNAA
jgi:membrane protein